MVFSTKERKRIASDSSNVESKEENESCQLQKHNGRLKRLERLRAASNLKQKHSYEINNYERTGFEDEDQEFFQNESKLEEISLEAFVKPLPPPPAPQPPPGFFEYSQEKQRTLKQQKTKLLQTNQNRYTETADSDVFTEGDKFRNDTSMERSAKDHPGPFLHEKASSTSSPCDVLVETKAVERTKPDNLVEDDTPASTSNDSEGSHNLFSRVQSRNKSDDTDKFTSKAAFYKGLAGSNINQQHHDVSVFRSFNEKRSDSVLRNAIQAKARECYVQSSYEHPKELPENRERVKRLEQKQSKLQDKIDVSCQVEIASKSFSKKSNGMSHSVGLESYKDLYKVAPQNQERKEFSMKSAECGSAGLASPLKVVCDSCSAHKQYENMKLQVDSLKREIDSLKKSERDNMKDQERLRLLELLHKTEQDRDIYWKQAQELSQQLYRESERVRQTLNQSDRLSLKVENLEAQNTQLERQHSLLKQENDNLKAYKQESGARIRELVNAHKANMEKLQQSLEHLNRQLAAKTKECTSLNLDLNQSKEDNKKVVNALATLVGGRDRLVSLSSKGSRKESRGHNHDEPRKGSLSSNRSSYDDDLAESVVSLREKLAISRQNEADSVRKLKEARRRMSPG